MSPSRCCSRSRRCRGISPSDRHLAEPDTTVVQLNLAGPGRVSPQTGDKVVHTALSIIFWMSCLGLGFSYLGYPLLVCLAARLRGAGQPRHEAAAARLPSVTILIAAYNAERHIAERIRNILACDYPQDRLEIVVASDGSTDGTVGVVHGFRARTYAPLHLPSDAANPLLSSTPYHRCRVKLSCLPTRPVVSKWTRFGSWPDTLPTPQSGS